MEQLPPQLPAKPQFNNQAATKGWRHFEFTRRILRRKSGSALMMAIFTVTMLMVIATEIVYETSIEFLISSQAVNQLKAYYAAKAGVEISLLRIHIFKKAHAMFGESLPDKSLLDPIWKFPFAWPPIVPKDTSGIDKEEIAAAVKKSQMQSQYLSIIESEGAKIDMNDLASPSQTIKDATRKQLKQIFDNKIEFDEKFAQIYRNFEFNKLLNNIADWIDQDTDSLNGGDEKNIYNGNLKGSDFIPPNQPFKTINELHMVEGITDELYELFLPRITVYGAKGINVNYASNEVLRSLPGIDEKAGKCIAEERAKPKRPPFKDLQDFVAVLQQCGVPTSAYVEGSGKDAKGKIPLLFDAEYNFRIKATGKSGLVTKDIIAIVYDFDRVKDRLSELGATPTPSATPTPNPFGSSPGTTPTPSPSPSPSASPAKKQIKVPTERPNVVYWSEG